MLIIGLMIGGALGTLGRYLLSTAMQPLTANAPLSLGTITVNILGCFIIGVLSNQRIASNIAPGWYLALSTGFTGAFTTFSTFELETNTLAREGTWSLASAYVFASLILGYAALLLGRFTASRFISHGT